MYLGTIWFIKVLYKLSSTSTDNNTNNAQGSDKKKNDARENDLGTLQIEKLRTFAQLTGPGGRLTV